MVTLGLIRTSCQAVNPEYSVLDPERGTLQTQQLSRQAHDRDHDILTDRIAKLAVTFARETSTIVLDRSGSGLRRNPSIVVDSSSSLPWCHLRCYSW